jgi:SpoVK/Ycf46/Vps4 family AAA+-type ATPase
VGETEKNIKAVFDAAREKKPCVLFFDEIDSLGRKRNEEDKQHYTDVVNAFLAQMDGAKNNNEGIFVIGATNKLGSMDDAFIRKGRFDKFVNVPLPNKEACLAILTNVNKKRANAPYINMDINYEKYANRLYYSKSSGADIQFVSDEAVRNALVREKIITPEKIASADIEKIDIKKTGLTITETDFDKAIERLEEDKKASSKNHLRSGNKGEEKPRIIIAR